MEVNLSSQYIINETQCDHAVLFMIKVNTGCVGVVFVPGSGEELRKGLFYCSLIFQLQLASLQLAPCKEDSLEGHFIVIG